MILLEQLNIEPHGIWTEFGKYWNLEQIKINQGLFPV